MMNTAVLFIVNTIHHEYGRVIYPKSHIHDEYGHPMNSPGLLINFRSPNKTCHIYKKDQITFMLLN